MAFRFRYVASRHGSRAQRSLAASMTGESMASPIVMSKVKDSSSHDTECEIFLTIFETEHDLGGSPRQEQWAGVLRCASRKFGAEVAKTNGSWLQYEQTEGKIL